MAELTIFNLRVNHLKTPLGYAMERQTFSWNYQCADRSAVVVFRVVIAGDDAFQNVLFDSGFDPKIRPYAYPLKLALVPYRCYWWKVEAACGEDAVSSEPAFFETGKCGEGWHGKWISPPLGSTGGQSPVIRREIQLSDGIRSARLYVTGLGLYECCFNGNLVNDGYLQPGFNNYNYWLQYQTFDVTGILTPGENVLSFLLGDGWYRGRFGVAGGHQNNFGEKLHLLYELRVTYADGYVAVIGSDGSERCALGPIQHSSIYDGEHYDATILSAGWMLPGFDDSDWQPVELIAPEKAGDLTERYSLPVTVQEKRKPAALITDPEGNTILDMGQNVTGWLVFQDHLQAGQTVRFLFAEHMEDGRISRKNLLTAKQEFVYTSNGQGGLVRPHFTYYGFQYVQVMDFPGQIDPEDFTVWTLYSDMPVTLRLRTGNEKVNRLLDNVLWSQKDNFLEHPSDCPQRAERLGWTGDAQMYCRTASYFMSTPAFYRKYIKDINEEQKRKDGMVPFIIPKIEAGDNFQGPKDIEDCSAAWSDVAVIIPWNQYVYFGDGNLLEEQYPGMKAWVEFMRRKDSAGGNRRLWQSGFHFGDWLSLDNPEPGPMGKTDPHYVASAYYYYSTSLLAKAAKVLGKDAEASEYGQLAGEIREAIQKEYFDTDGICKQDTQTAYVLAIHFELVPKAAQQANGDRLAEKIRRNGTHLDTGFVGTPYLCFALSKTGHDDVAFDLLMQEEAPGWLFEVNQGATTIWEAWDALDETGHITGDMSLNHYTYGSIAEWIIAESCGLQPSEAYPGFSKVRIAPKPDPRLGFLRAEFDSPSGTYVIQWAYREDGSVSMTSVVPHGVEAEIVLPDNRILEGDKK